RPPPDPRIRWGPRSSIYRGRPSISVKSRGLSVSVEAAAQTIEPHAQGHWWWTRTLRKCDHSCSGEPDRCGSFTSLSLYSLSLRIVHGWRPLLSSKLCDFAFAI